jgi:hypothetical protein
VTSVFIATFVSLSIRFVELNFRVRSGKRAAASEVSHIVGVKVYEIRGNIRMYRTSVATLSEA